MTAFPPPLGGFTLTDLRRGILVDGLPTGTQAQRRERARFRQDLEKWVESGGCCDLLSAANVENSSISHFPPHVKSKALRRAPETVVSIPDELQLAKLLRTLSGVDQAGSAEHSPHDEGYCYLSFVRDDSWGRAVSDLGYNPWGCGVLEWLMENPSLHYGGKYTVTLGTAKLSSGYTQAHVERSSDGMDWHHALSFNLVSVRFGATGPTMAAAMETAEANGVPSVLGIAPRGPSLRISIPFGFVVETPGKDSARWALNDSSALARFTQYFESVLLEEFHAAAVVHQGDNATLLRLALTGSPAVPVGNSQWMTAPHSSFLSGNIQGGTAVSMTLPSNHNFGRQLASPSVGNPPPVLHAYLTGNVPSFGFVKGHIVVSVAGMGLPTALAIRTFGVGPGAQGAVRNTVSLRSRTVAGSQANSPSRNAEPDITTDDDAEDDE